jgi:hypothetical protein
MIYNMILPFKQDKEKAISIVFAERPTVDMAMKNNETNPASQ